MEKYSTLILDDDIDNLQILKTHLQMHCPFIEVVAEAINVREGLRAYAATKPQILLLDINLGKEDVFSFIDSIGKTNSEIIFISSHTEYGVKAVNYNVTGFIVKPMDVDRLKSLINKAIFNLEQRFTEDKIDEGFPSNIAIPSMQNIELVAKDSIAYLEADGKYTNFFLMDGTHKIASRNLGEYEKILNPKQFFRIHHRYLVNTNKIANIHKTDGGYCELNYGKILPIAKRRQNLLHRFLKLK